MVSMLASLTGALRGLYISVTTVSMSGGGLRMSSVRPACLPANTHTLQYNSLVTTPSSYNQKSVERQNRDRKSLKRCTTSGSAHFLPAMMDSPWIAILRAATERPPLLLLSLTFSRGSCLSMLKFPGDWFMPFLFLLWWGAHLSRPAGRLWILIVETAVADCCQGFSAGIWMSDFIYLFIFYIFRWNSTL